MESNYWAQRRRYTRRGILRGAGIALGVVSLAPVIAACGSSAGGTKSGTNTTSNAGGASGGGATEARRASAPGVTVDTILLGTTFGLTGPGSSYAPIVQTLDAYFKKVNDEGGVNGRKIQLKIEDDAYTAANTPPLAKRLVEQDHVFAMVANLGTPTNSTIVDYLNDQKVPHLYVSTGATKWGDSKKYPWTMGLQPSYSDEAKAFGKYIAKTWPGKKVGILYQNDDFGKDYLVYKETIGSNNPTVDEETYETTAADVNTQITNLKNKGAEVFVLIAIPKFAGLALKAAADQGWKPNIIMTNVSADPSLFGLAGGPQNVEGVISNGYFQQWDSGDASIQPVKDLLAKYAPQVQLANFPVFGYMQAQLIVETLKRAGANPTRDSVLAAAESFKDYKIDQLLPGITVTTSKTDHYPIQAVKLTKATSGKFVFFGDVITSG